MLYVELWMHETNLVLPDAPACMLENNAGPRRGGMLTHWILFSCLSQRYTVIQ